MSKSRQRVAPLPQSGPDETKYPWLTILLDSFAICDEGTRQDLKRDEKRTRRAVACHKGCSACCVRPAVPISTPELRGVSWYVSERLDHATQDRLIPRLRNHQASPECPFLLDRECAIYPMRPIACRIFHVYTSACYPSEDVFQSRPGDIFIQDRDTARRVGMRFLDSDVYGLNTMREKKAAFDREIMLSETIPMHYVNWEALLLPISKIRGEKSNTP